MGKWDPENDLKAFRWPQRRQFYANDEHREKKEKCPGDENRTYSGWSALHVRSEVKSVLINVIHRGNKNANMNLNLIPKSGAAS